MFSKYVFTFFNIYKGEMKKEKKTNNPYGPALNGQPMWSDSIVERPTVG